MDIGLHGIYLEDARFYWAAEAEGKPPDLR